jgi:hypothetical protein
VVKGICSDKAVILRESGVSSTPQLLDSITSALEYWIVRRSLSSGARSRDPVADDDDWICGVVLAT